MDLIADILLVAGALGAGFYCYILARRLTRFNDLETGVGGAVAVLSAQVDDLNKALIKAQAASGESSEVLADLTVRAESVSQRLELMMASMHDLPDTSSSTVRPSEAVVPSPVSETPPPDPDVDTSTPEAVSPVERPAEPIFMRHSADRKGAA